MPFQPGNQLAKGTDRQRPKLIAQQLTSALNEAAAQGDVSKVRKIVDRLIAKAIEGDVPAIKEILDRVDGKVPQGIAGPDGEGPVEMVIGWERLSE